MIVVTVIGPLSLVFAGYLKRSRDAESVKNFQHGGKRGKFRRSPGKRRKIVGLLPGRTSFFQLGPGVFKGHGSVEYQCIGGRILVGTEVSQSLELIPFAGRCLAQAGLNQTACDSLQRVGVEVSSPIVVSWYLR